MRYLVFTFMLVFILSLVGCNFPKSETIGGIKVNVLSYSIGLDEDTGLQQLSYSFDLQNSENYSVYVKDIALVPTDTLSDKVINAPNSQNIDKTLAPGSSINVVGKFEIDNASKDAFSGQLISGVKIDSSIVLSLPGQ